MKLLAKAQNPGPMHVVFHPLATISPHDALELVLEPLDSLGLIYAVSSANLALASSSLGHTLAWSGPMVPAVSNHVSKISRVFISKNIGTYMQQ